MGREKHDENRRDHYTVMSRTMMETPAWGRYRPSRKRFMCGCALSGTASGRTTTARFS